MIVWSKTLIDPADSPVIFGQHDGCSKDQVHHMIEKHRRLAQNSQVSNMWLFLRARPAQRKLPHDPAIDYLVWPGMCERLVLEKIPHGNAFWARLFRDFRFCWPGDSTRALEPSSRTQGLLAFSDEYRRRLSDLTHWMFDVGFFRDFPGLEDDVLPICLIPRSLALRVKAAEVEHGDKAVDDVVGMP